MSAEDWIPDGWMYEPLRDAMDRIAQEMQRRPRRTIFFTPPPQPKSCRYCGRGGLFWTTHRGKSRLMYPNGDLHTCREAAEYYSRRRREPWRHLEDDLAALDALVEDYEQGRTGPNIQEDDNS